MGGPCRPAACTSGLSLPITFLITFLKLSAKLYTSVFHHGPRVGGLSRAPWEDCADTAAAGRGLLFSPSPGVQPGPLPARPLRNSPATSSVRREAAGHGRVGCRTGRAKGALLVPTPPATARRALSKSPSPTPSFTPQG